MREKKLSSIKREKLYKKNFKSDTTETLSQELKEKGNEEKFYEPLAKLMTLMIQLNNDNVEIGNM